MCTLVLATAAYLVSSDMTIIVVLFEWFPWIDMNKQDHMPECDLVSFLIYTTLKTIPGFGRNSFTIVTSVKWSSGL